MPSRDNYVEAWKALVELKKAGRIRSIGVSNFNAEQIDRIVGETGVVPALNQVELHPRFQQRPLRAACAERGIAVESWSPLGRGALLDEPTIRRIADKHGRTGAQVIIRWHLQSGLVVIPKSAHPPRIAENFDVFGFVLNDEDMAQIAAMDRPDGRLGPDPMTASF